MANLNLNKVILGGRITNDLELRQTQSGISVISFGIAVNRPYSKNTTEKQADFINCVAWRTTAEFISKYFRKGSSICVTGSIQTRNWTDQQNVKHYATDVVIDEAMFVDAKGDAPSAYTAPAVPQDHDAPPAPAYSTPQAETPNFSNVEDDDDLPF